MSGQDFPSQPNAKVFFEKARSSAAEGAIERAIDEYLQGLRHNPEAVQDGHIELRVLALKRRQRGGKRPSSEEVTARLGQGVDPVERMINAEYLLSKDPEHLPYAQAMLRAAVEGKFELAAKWIADLIFLANNGATRPSLQVYLFLKQAYTAIGRLDRAFAACNRAVRLRPNDAALEAELRRLAVKLNASGKRVVGDGTASLQGSDDEFEAEMRQLNATLAEERGETGPDAAGALVDREWAKAKAFFDQAKRATEKKQYDYAIDMYLQGLAQSPDALEEGHLPLAELGLLRRNEGGKKPTMMERVKRLRGKNPVEQMLNAEYLFVKDPDHLPYAEAMLKAAVDAGCSKTAHWIANLIFQTNNAVEKPSFHTYILLKDSYKALGKFDKAVAACQRACNLKPESKELADEFKNLSAELTMASGKYDQEGDFRQSIRDAETQAKLYAQDRVVKTTDYRASAVEDARRALEKDPDLAKNVYNLADALADLETDEADAEAIQLLENARETRQDFSFGQRAGLIRIRRIKRHLRRAKKALESSKDSRQAHEKVARLSEKLNSVELEHYRLCMENYPTSLQAKYDYALRLVANERYDEAIPLLQEAQRDPRRRISSLERIGYCFFMKGWFVDAIDVFSEALEAYEIKDDAVAKELRYNLGRAHEEQGETAQALEVYRKLAQLDFGYKDVSGRVDRLRKSVQGQ